MADLDKISQAIGALQSGQDERRNQGERLERALADGLGRLERQVAALAETVGARANKHADEDRERFEAIEGRVTVIEREQSTARGARRANAAWASGLVALGAAALEGGHHLVKYFTGK